MDICYRCKKRIWFWQRMLVLYVSVVNPELGKDLFHLKCGFEHIRTRYQRGV